MSNMETVYEPETDLYEGTMPFPKNFRRSKEPIDTRINEEAMEVLYLLYRYKFLNSEHIARHLPHRSNDWLRKTLKRMFHAHLVDRPLEQIYFGKGEFLIYELNKRGYAELENAVDLDASVTPNYGAMRMAGGKEFKHSLMICETLSSLELGAKEAGVRFISWEEIVPDGERFEFRADFTYPTSRGPKHVTNHRVKPDGFFGLEYQNGKKAYFALETQNTSPNRPDTDRRAAVRSSAMKKFLSYRDIVSKQMYKELGIGNMRVLVVAPSKTKLDNQLAVLKELTAASHLFLGQVIPVYGAKFTQPRPFPELFNAPWLRVGLPPEKINAPTISKT